MKKIFSLVFTFAILLSLLSIPAYALVNDQMNQTNSYRANDHTNAPINTFIPQDGTPSYKTNNISNDRINNYGMNRNNYRTNALNDNRDFNWSWLGLLGLAGLFGLRNRERERS